MSAEAGKAAGEHPVTGYDVSSLTPQQNYKLLCGGVVPRPIAWVSCQSQDGTPNIAPFSYFNIMASDPPILGFSVSKSLIPGKGIKDTLTFVRESGEFVINIASAELIDELVLTSIEYPPDVDEFEVAGLTAAACKQIKAPRIAEAPVSFECVLHSTVDLGGSVWVAGSVVYAHFRKGLVDDENHRIDTTALRPLGRMPGPTFSTQMNVVRRAASLAEPAAGADSTVVWLRDEQ